MVEVKCINNIIYVNKDVNIEELDRIKCDRCIPRDFYRWTHQLKCNDIFKFNNAWVCCPLNIYCLIEEGEDYGEI